MTADQKIGIVIDEDFALNHRTKEASN